MTWATKRQLTVISVLVALLLVLIAAVAFFFLYKPASCVDGKQNQNETGVDCGGSCSTFCASEASSAIVRFVRVLTPVPGRTDVIAYIDNPNDTAEARGVHLTLELYDDAQVKIATQQIILDLPIKGTVPLYISNVGDGTATRAFLTFNDGGPLWTKATQKPTLPIVKDGVLQNTQTPRITAKLQNPVASTLKNITLIATVFDEKNNAIAATQTFVTELPSQGTATIVFSWNAPFVGTPVRFDIVPVPTL